MSASVKEGRLFGSAIRAVLATAAATVMLAACASAAQASISLSSNGLFGNPDTVGVSGTVPAAFSTATHFTVAQCNVSATVGTRCNAGSAIGFTPVASYAFPGVTLTLNKSFSDFNFVTNSPAATSTTCKGLPINSQCGVMVSYYRFSMGVPVHLGVDPDSTATSSWVTFS